MSRTLVPQILHDSCAVPRLGTGGHGSAGWISTPGSSGLAPPGFTEGYLKDAGIERDLRDAVADTIYSGHVEDPAGGSRPEARALSPIAAGISGGEPGREA